MLTLQLVFSAVNQQGTVNNSIPITLVFSSVDLV